MTIYGGISWISRILSFSLDVIFSEKEDFPLLTEADENLDKMRRSHQFLYTTISISVFRCIICLILHVWMNHRDFPHLKADFLSLRCQIYLPLRCLTLITCLPKNYKHNGLHYKLVSWIIMCFVSCRWNGDNFYGYSLLKNALMYYYFYTLYISRTWVLYCWTRYVWGWKKRNGYWSEIVYW